ncbi:hypothetical protein LTR84_008023 [Exophiala bonariae]|uniref:Wings apart-like protein C-terminal domain-containing protein n=1 Tax=Exophiala bonariae TaxID=1690606 RepID=A0AAV9NLU4_9EURO|nr:hypothetical protein LTR84_008023 [Exophiala bonariae]
MMDFQSSRRKANTYGKGGARKILVHDIFDITSVSSRTPLSSQDTPSNALFNSSSPTDYPQSTAPVTQNTWTDRRDVNSVVNTMDLRPTTPSSTTGSSPCSSTNTPAVDMFDIQSSGEDAPYKINGPLNKKRKVIPVQSRADSERINKDNARPYLGLSKQSDRISKTISKPSSLKGNQSGATKTASKPVKRQQPLARTYVPQNSIPRKTRVSSGSSAHLSDTSASSPRVSRQTTPKRKIQLSDDGSNNASSPSDLQMTSLRLTPERTVPHQLSEDMEMSDGGPVQATPRKGRKRLIDRLDGPCAKAPEKSGSSIGDNDFSAGESSYSQPVSGYASPARGLQQAPGNENGNLATEEPKPAPPVRMPRTYAKQRSHLSDMLDSLEPSSQHSSQQSYSQPTSFTSFASQMDLGLEDDDSEEVSSFKQPKSIHELRRAGAITKFDNELSTVLDEVESGIKSARIRGLIQLLKKLANMTFLRHFLDSGGLARFNECADSTLDEVSGTLMIAVFQRMTSATHVSPETMVQILAALYRLPSTLGTTHKPLSKVAKDRRQNLPKLLLSELNEYEDTSSSQAGHRALPISLIFYTALANTLHPLVKLGEHYPPLPSPLLDDILRAVIAIQKTLNLEAEREDSTTSLNTLLSTLEIASFSRSLVTVIERSAHFPALRESLADLMEWARQAQQPLLEQSCLKFIVSLSNNQPEICSRFAEGPLIARVYAVVDDHFCRMATSAVQAQELDSEKLDAAVLALGCLLNFADCADVAREKMLEKDQNGRRLVDGLVDIFNSYVDLTSEADTMDQTQVLIPLGYISMLLCTLCLNPQANELIAHSTKGPGLEQLFLAVETFLTPLRQVEMDLAANGGSPSGSFERFMVIYEAVRQKAA